MKNIFCRFNPNRVLTLSSCFALCLASVAAVLPQIASAQMQTGW
jgi:hypothetical protein